MSKKLFLLTLSIALPVFAGNTWIETTHEDFADGAHENTIYASHRSGGTVEFVSRFDLNNDGYIDLVTCDIGGPYVTIHWGSKSGYSSNNQTHFAATGAGNCDIADLNIDGYAEFLVSHCNSVSRLSIYWGSSTGPSQYNAYHIPNSPSVPNEVCYTADLNKDGYLDIIIGTYYSLYTGSVFWGSANGYSPLNRTDLPTAFGAHNTEVADLNNDGWFDIVFVNNNSSMNYIYWGSENGYSSSNMLSLAAPTSTPHGSSIADLNNDGYLDLIFTSVYGSQSFIYYGSINGFQNYQALNTGSTYGGSAVCYMNNDQYLDIIFFRGWPSALKTIIYWGSSTGYSDNYTTEIGSPTNASGGYVGDFNLDGHIDVFVNSRSSYSPIFWGPDYLTSTNIAVSRDHHALFREIGNVYNREYYEDYISSVFDAGATTEWCMIEWDAYQPSGTAVLVWVRTGNTPTPDQSWSEWKSVSNGGSIPANLKARYIQYKARLCFANPCFLPMLEQMTIGYGSTAPILAEVRIEPEVINLQSHGKFTAFITLPPGYNPFNIDISTVECEGAPAVYGHAAAQGLFYIAKFKVQDLIGVTPGPAVQFTVTGQLFDGTAFIGYDTVRVIGHDNVVFNITPNPFKEKTSITMTCPGSSDISVRIYNVNGALVRDFNTMSEISGVATITWNKKDNSGRIMPAGIYLFKIQTENTSVTRKVIILK
ncbi:MAG: T9SS type A sorting domain-containing protein [bacterium]